MADITNSVTITDARQGDTGWIQIETPTTADNTDTFNVDLTKYGATGILWVEGHYWTGGSTIWGALEQTAYTTSVSNGTLTITIGSTGGANKKRIFNVGLRNG